MSRALARLAATSAVALLLGGCAGVLAQRERARGLASRLDAYRLPSPLDTAWPKALRLLADLDFPLAEADAKAVGQRYEPRFMASLTARSRATQDDGTVRLADTDWGPGGVRYHLEGRAEGDHCRILLWQVAEDRTERNRDAGTRRDAELELKLVTQLDPAAAPGLEAGLPVAQP